MFCSTVLSLFSFASSCLSSCLHSFPTRRSSDLEVVRVLAELVVRQANDEPLDRAGREDQQEKAADQLEEAVQPLEDDTDFEGDVEPEARHGLRISASRAALHNPTANAH